MYIMHTKMFVKCKILTLICLSFMLSLSAQNQSNPNKSVQNTFSYEKFLNEKKQFIQEHLTLTTAEANRFWPVYVERETEKREIRQRYTSKCGQSIICHFKLEKATDEEIYQILESKMNKSKDILILEEKIYQKMKQILPAKKLFRLQQLENEFKKKMIERMKLSTPKK